MTTKHIFFYAWFLGSVARDSGFGFFCVRGVLTGRPAYCVLRTEDHGSHQDEGEHVDLLDWAMRLGGDAASHADRHGHGVAQDQNDQAQVAVTYLKTENEPKPRIPADSRLAIVYTGKTKV